MDVLFYFYMFVLGLLFWSFSSVLISRIKKGKSWILFWRSECPNCNHTLWAFDLIPIFSYLFSFWKCRYCFKKISFLYPVLELFTWILFILITYFLIDVNLIFSWNLFEISRLVFFLLFWFLTVVYVFYDILYLEIPDSILGILNFLILWALFLQWFFWFKILGIWDSDFLSIWLQDNIYIFSSIFLVLISFYFIMLKWLSEIWDFLIIFFLWWIIVYLRFFLWIELENTFLWSSLIALFLSFLFFFLQIIISWWAWMWWWDLRIAILLWLTLWYSFWFYWILISYIVWASVWIFILVYQKTREYYIAKKDYLNKVRKIIWLRPNKVTLDTQIPFWPFLAFWILFVLFFSREITKFLNYIYSINYF